MKNINVFADKKYDKLNESLCKLIIKKILTHYKITSYDINIIFNLYEIEGFSHDEIAKQLHIPDSTSRTYLTRAKQKLRMLYLEQHKIRQEFK